MVIVALAAALLAHPLHTTLTELTMDAPHHSLRAVVRVFADDLAAASKRSGSADAYIAAGLSVDAGVGERIRFTSCGTRRTGDLLWICLDGSFTGSPSELRVSNTLLCDRFSDQVNIVQLDVGSEKRSVLFTRGDSPKRLSVR